MQFGLDCFPVPSYQSMRRFQLLGKPGHRSRDLYLDLSHKVTKARLDDTQIPSSRTFVFYYNRHILKALIMTSHQTDSNDRPKDS